VHHAKRRLRELDRVEQQSTGRWTYVQSQLQQLHDAGGRQPQRREQLDPALQ
jgi:hypothetical protein